MIVPIDPKSLLMEASAAQVDVGDPRVFAQIPKIIHQMWMGNQPAPDKMDLWRQYCQARNYRYISWDIDEVRAMMDSASLNVLEQYVARQDWPGVADVGRYTILNQEGGFWVDCDFAPPPVDMITLSGGRGLMVVTEHDSRQLPDTTSWFLMNGLFGCPPNHPVVQHVVDTLPKNANTWKKNTGSLDAQYSSGPFFWTRSINGPVTLIPCLYLHSLGMY